MSNSGLWIVDSETKEERFILYSELEEETRKTVIKPIGGFIFEVGAFLAADLPSVPFYVEDWLPKRGKSLLYAPPKSGKSFLCMQLARCVGAGESFLGHTTTQGRVMYVQFELGEEVLQARFRDTGKTYDNVFVGTSFSLKLDSKGGQKYIWEAMEAVKPHVLILDPWYKTLLGDENESHDVEKILDFLDSMIEYFNCSIQIIHHAGKDLSKRGRGTSVLEDWVDSYIKMNRTSKAGEPLRVKIEPVFLRHAPLPADPIEAELVNFEFVLKDKMKSVRELVAEFIQGADGEVSPAQLFAEGIGTNTSVYTALKELSKDGLIEREERGRYEWVRK